MRVEDWFALALRIVGVIVFLHGLGLLLDSFLFRFGFFNYSESSPEYYVMAGLSFSFVGLYLIRGAPFLVRLAYPKKEEEEREQEGDDKNEDQQD